MRGAPLSPALRWQDRAAARNISASCKARLPSIANLASSTSGVSGSTLGYPYLGILQNTPGPGQAARCSHLRRKQSGGRTDRHAGSIAFSFRQRWLASYPVRKRQWSRYRFRHRKALLTGAVFTVELYPFANFGGSS